ncbi:Acetyltransferases [Marinactinospora thermotolerans DSM 45154]|uniref:Acetyltransferases n=1 Tax=Marinactinospora thermotolerans DSM 45154 TaxID=1122192 RepID=A0A1T4TEY2_9ACTN|nr:GNAT family N-acetyltransferase [Marinactinospora thermotolerans]SKA38996.1 Acetyltransferases [Marinactinospora thermotolerans DSM 45154]
MTGGKALPAVSGPRDGEPVGGAREHAVQVLTAAFREDVLLRWLAPEHPDRMFASVVAESAAAGGLDVLDGAAAVWLAWSTQDAEADEPPGPRPSARLSTYLAATAMRHPKDRPHTTLQFLGVHPAHQGRGLGTALLVRGLARADAAGLPAYLEVDSPRNAGWYARHGFAPLGDPIVLPDGPTIQPMWREPASAFPAGSGRERP